MNIEQANAIALPEILHKIGCTPFKNKGAEIWYHSPLRNERTASFHVNTLKNVWYDFGLAKGGDVVSFIRAYLESLNEDSTPVDALRWLRNMTLPSLPVKIPEDTKTETAKALTLWKVQELSYRPLIQYLEVRGISAGVAKKYVQEIIAHNANSGKKFYSIGLPTEGDGYELRNKFFKGCIGDKSISFIRGTCLPAEELHIFEGMMDFLSAASMQKENVFSGDVIILNSVSCLPQVFPYIKGYIYRSLYTWLDNDHAGRKATEILKELCKENGMPSFHTMNSSYEPDKDVNEWHVKQRSMPI